MCSETSEAVGTTWEHAQLEFQNFLKIRITLLPHPIPLNLTYVIALKLAKSTLPPLSPNTKLEM